MTCQEFRHLITTEINDSTAGLRAVAYKHYLECQECHRMIDAITVLPDDHEDAKAICNMAHKDFLDPEVRSVIGLVDPVDFNQRSRV